jgi:hypothetical protein
MEQGEPPSYTYTTYNTSVISATSLIFICGPLGQPLEHGQSPHYELLLTFPSADHSPVIIGHPSSTLTINMLQPCLPRLPWSWRFTGTFHHQGWSDECCVGRWWDRRWTGWRGTGQLQPWEKEGCWSCVWATRKDHLWVHQKEGWDRREKRRNSSHFRGPEMGVWTAWNVAVRLHVVASWLGWDWEGQKGGDK